VYCPECGFHQSDAHRYCGRCGALLIVEGQTDEITGGFSLDDDETGGWAAAGVGGPALAVRSGGGLSGQIFPIATSRLTVGRSPTSDVFLDDVTVSRNHAVLSRDGGGIVLEDLGSLNGTYVNRRRIEAPEQLQDGDELQIGKFRLAFIAG
jgi:FHA domain